MTSSPATESALPTEAIEQLRNNQKQLDMDGTVVGVSRQAIEEVLAYIDRRPPVASPAGRGEAPSAGKGDSAVPQHTPGPWTLERGEYVHRGWHVVTAQHVGMHAASPLAFLSPILDEVDPSAMADARLIAAAPDLLEALKAIRKALCSDAPSGPQKIIDGDDTIYRLDGQTMYHALNAARAAITKATQASQPGGEANPHSGATP